MKFNYINYKSRGIPLLRMIKSVLLISLVSIFMSIVMFSVIILMFPNLPKVKGLIASIVIPAVVAPVAASINVRNRYRLEILTEKLSVAKDKMEASVRAKDAFIANMSHEFRTPLTHIIGFGELLEREIAGPLTVEQREYVKNIMSSAKFLLSIVNSVLDLAQIEAGKAPAVKKPIDIAMVVSECLNSFSDEARKKNIELTHNIERVKHTLLVAEEHIRHIVYNLLSNSLKFTHEGGHVHVRLYEELDQGENSWLHIEVRDTGIGIEKYDTERIFDLFEQVEAGMERNYSGIGVGLAFSKKLIDLYNGRIWVESPGRGKGSTFHVTIPMEQKDS